MRLKPIVWVLLLALPARGATAQDDPPADPPEGIPANLPEDPPEEIRAEVPDDPLAPRAVEAVEKATRDVRSLRAAYTRTGTRIGLSGKFTESGTVLWKRMPDGTALARWDGEDHEGPILTLVRDGRISIWRGEKKLNEHDLDPVAILHPSVFSFPLFPRDCRTAYRIDRPEISPDHDSRYPGNYSAGIPRLVVFSPRSPERRRSFKMLSYSIDTETGLAYRFRCDTFGWLTFWVDVDDWEIDPELPPTAFDPPKAASRDGTDKGAGKEGKEGKKDEKK